MAGQETENIFFRPENGWVGDVIPYQKDDLVHLFFLRDSRDSDRPGTPWDRYTTQDFNEFSYTGTALPNGGTLDQDLNCYTGSVVEFEDVTHLFYTGVNPKFLAPDTNQPIQIVMHATSVDGMKTWIKHPNHSFGAPSGYDPRDWRDPFVYRPEKDGPWYMLISARVNSGPSRRRGVIACCISNDLESWQVVEPFWAPNRYVMHECPEVFAIGQWWYLVFSEFSDRFVTRYRMSRSPFGPWTVPIHDTIDGRAFYAAKSVEFQNSRYFAGWIPTKVGEVDDGDWQWAGDLCVHKAEAAEDGTLEFKIPDALYQSFRIKNIPIFESIVGDWVITQDSMHCDELDGYGVIVAKCLPNQYLFEVTIEIGEDTTECGVVLGSSEDGEEGYIVRLEPRVGRLVFDRWPREITGAGQWQISGDISQIIELERIIDIQPGLHNLKIIVDGSACVTYLDDRVAMSARMYNLSGDHIALFVGEGSVAFSDVSLATRQ